MADRRGDDLGEPTTPLRALAVKSAAWYGGTRLWGQAVSWGVTVLLARLLIPADFGLFAIALSVLTVLELLQEFGLGTAIIQHRDLTHRQISAIFWMVALASLTLTAITFFTADAIARFYAEPRLAWILRILCFTFLLNSLGMIPYNLLTKAIDLRHRSLAEALGTVTSALIALTLAYFGYGVLALVLGHLGRAVVVNIALTVFARWIPGLDIATDGMRSIMVFGLRIAGTQLVGTLSVPVTTFILARVIGGAAVGLYAMAQGLAEAPHRFSTAIINQVSFPVFSRLQREQSLLRAYFLKISKYLAVVALPVQFGLLLVAPDLVPVLLSAKWQEMVIPFQIFCLEYAVIFLTLTSSPLLTARGRAALLLKLSFLSLATFSAAVIAGASFGLVGVATAELLAVVALRLTLVIPSLREIDLRVSAYLANIVSPVLATAAMSVVVMGTQHALGAPTGVVERLILAVLAGVLTYPTALLLLDRDVVNDVRAIIRDLSSHA